MKLKKGGLISSVNLIGSIEIINSKNILYSLQSFLNGLKILMFKLFKNDKRSVMDG